MKNFFQGFQGAQGGFYQNPASLAGLLVAGGKSYNDALIEAAEVSRQQQMAAMQKQQMELAQQQALMQAEQQRQLQSRIGNLLLGKPNVSQSEIALELLNSGLDPKNIASLANALSNEQKINDVFNPVTGEIVRKVNGQVVGYPQGMQAQSQEINTPIQAGQSLSEIGYGQTPAGQRDLYRAQIKSQEKPSLTQAEVRINKTKLKDVNSDARAAQNELRILEDLEKAFDKLDKNSGGFTGSGSIAAKTATNIPYTPNLLYNEKGQSALEQIEKNNSLLFQNRIKAAGARATDAFKSEVKKGLPTASLTPEARQEVIQTKKRENFEQILRSKFFTEWYKQNGKDLEGAEDAFISFVNQAPLVDENNNLNKPLLEQIPQIVNSYNPQAQGFEIDSEEEIITPDEIDLESFSLQDLLQAKKAKRGRR